MIPYNYVRVMLVVCHLLFLVGLSPPRQRCLSSGTISEFMGSATERASLVFLDHQESLGLRCVFKTFAGIKGVGSPVITL